jgi:hypothetical protein
MPIRALEMVRSTLIRILPDCPLRASETRDLGEMGSRLGSAEYAMSKGFSASDREKALFLGVSGVGAKPSRIR